MTEHERALMEGEQIGASDRFFSARAHLDNEYSRHMFEQGFIRAWKIAKAPQVGAGSTATLHQNIRSAQIAAGEDAVIANLRSMGLA